MLMTTNKSLTLTIVLMMIFIISNAQISPYSLSPKWYFGNKAGLDFTSGSPIFLPNGQTNTFTDRIEGAHNICDPSKNVVFYSGGYTLYDANHVLIQNVNGGTSSTQSGVSIPDPADPANKFYFFSANVDNNSGGDRPPSNWDLGIHYYHIQKSGTSITILSGPIKIANNDEVSEQLSSSVDGNGNYWVVAHQGGSFSGGMNSFWSWPVTATGVGTKVTSSVAGTVGNNPWQGSIKINKCQTRLASVYGSGGIEVYNWNASTGKVVSLIRSTNIAPSAYGCEFSPDGNILYITSLVGNKLYQLDIASGTMYTNAAWVSANNGGDMGTLQLGPDDKIYVTNGGNMGTPSYIGVVNQPDIAGAGCNYVPTGFLLNSGPGLYPNIARGISNISWINPNPPVINHSGCPTVSFSYNFRTYFNDNITVVPNSEEWDFGLGAGFQSGLGPNPSKVYPSNNIYNVSLRVRDQTCNTQWTSTIVLNTDCSLPVEWLSVEAKEINDVVKILWTTTKNPVGDKFIIERSEDGIHFFPIGEVPSINENNPSYEFTDTFPSEGENYYRIKQQDQDGLFSYTKIILVSIKEGHFILINNFNENNFTFKTLNKSDAQIAVFDILGKELLSSILTSNLTFGENFSSGNYIVRINLRNNTFFRRIIKE
jgi:hypothetical protein